MTEQQLAVSADPPPDDGSNITDWALGQFHEAYGTTDITKDDVYEYVYGVMHAPDWRDKYGPQLSKKQPRIPLAADFEAFRVAGAELMDLHANYETCPQYLDVTINIDGFPIKLDDHGEPVDAEHQRPGLYRLALGKKMRWVDPATRKRVKAADRSEADWLEVNASCHISGIPAAAHQYDVSGRSPLEWAMAVLVHEIDKKTKNVVDYNTFDAWADDAFELIRHLRRLTYIGVRSTEIITSLPPSLDGPAVPAFANSAA